MEEPSSNSPPRRYRWPWFVAAGLILWVLASVVWMCFAVRHVREERDFSAPSANPSH